MQKTIAEGLTSLGFNLPNKYNLSQDVMLELSRHIHLHHYKPYQVILKSCTHGASAADMKYNMVLEGSILGWKRSVKRNEKGEWGKETSEYKSESVAARKGSVLSPI